MSGRNRGSSRRSFDPGDLDRDRVQREAKPVLDRWQSGVALFEVRRRLQGVVSAGLVVVAAQFLLDPGGLAGLLITLWFLLSVPVVAVAACVLVLLQDPESAPGMWWENGTVATAGLVSLAGITRFARLTPAGRVAWQFLFGSDHPAEEEYRFGADDEEIDLSAVARIRRYVWYAIVGSAGIVLAETAIRNDIFAAGVFDGLLGIDPGPAAWAGLFVALAGLGFLAGWFAASIDL